jgi:hypothetical protein
MSVAWYIVLERKIPSFDCFVNGKALAHASKALDALAEQAGVRPLMKFFSVSSAELAGLGIGSSKALPSEQWFAAGDGLNTVRALVLAAEKNTMDAKVVDDLKEFENVRATAKQHGVRWHLAVDF